jgi:hypothetical protein
MATPDSTREPIWAQPVVLVDATFDAYYNASSGGGGTPVAPYAPTPLGYQQVPATAALTALTVSSTATFAVITTEGNAARWRDDGTNPTATVGMPLNSGVPTQFSGDLAALRFIAQSGTTTYNVSYYK